MSDQVNQYIETVSVKRGQEIVSHLWEHIDGLGYISGSFAAYAVAPDDGHIVYPGDIDIFAISDEAASVISHRLAAIGYFWLAENAIANTLAWSIRVKMPAQFGFDDQVGLDVQVIKPHPDWSNFPNDIIASFDLDICRALLINRDIGLADRSVGLMHARILRVNDPLKTLNRIIKYANRGVVFSNHELIKVFQAWSLWSDEKRSQAIKVNMPDLEEFGESITLDVEEEYGGWYDEDDWFNGE